MEKDDLQNESSNEPSSNGSNEERSEPAAPKKPSIVQRTMTKLKLSPITFILMIKMALPPVIALAVEQNTEAAQFFTTLGYLPAIIATLGVAIMPRAKFLQTILLNVLFTCLSAAVALLQLYCGVKARENTSPPITPQDIQEAKAKSPNGVLRPPYNSSQNAVVGLWLFFNIWLINTVRASRPQLQIPAIVYSIFANIAGVYGPGLPTTEDSLMFVRKLLICFLTGFGYATFVSLVVFPISNRKVWFVQTAGYVKTIQAALMNQLAYFQTLEKEDMFSIGATLTGEDAKGSKKSKKARPTLSPAEAGTQKIKATLMGMGELMGKLHGDIAFAKRELAWGKLNAEDISELFRLLQLLALPMIGLASTGDVFHRLAIKRGWLDDVKKGDEGEDEAVHRVRKHWNDIMVALHDPLQVTITEIIDGLQHALYRLELAPNPNAKKSSKKGAATNIAEDVEAEAGVVKAGDPKYREHLATRIGKIRDMRMAAIKTVLTEKMTRTNDLPGALDPDTKEKGVDSADEKKRRESLEGQLFLILYVSLPLPAVCCLQD